MGRINMKGVIIGGLVAGVILNILDYLVWGVLLAPDIEAALQGIGKPMDPSIMPVFIVLDFLYGIALVYLYAAIRPRFGPGPSTAVIAGLLAWVLVGLLHAVAEAPMGLLPRRIYLIGTLAGLIVIPLATVVGARFYTEPA